MDEIDDEEKIAYDEFVRTHSEEEILLLTNEIRLRKKAWNRFLRREGIEEKDLDQKEFK